MTPWITGAALAGEPRLAEVVLPPGVTLADCCAKVSEELWGLSGRQFGLVTETVRPSRLVLACGCGAALAGVAWLGCGCGSVAQLPLRSPVSEIAAVKVDGVAISAYALYDGHLLVRTDGLPWPCCQDLSQPDGALGTWSVTYTHGRPVPAGGVLAARELVITTAQELAGKTGKLPSRTVTNARQGVTVTLADASWAKDGLTGIPLVDRWVSAVNPHRRSRRAQCVSPDTIALSART